MKHFLPSPKTCTVPRVDLFGILLTAILFAGMISPAVVRGGNGSASFESDNPAEVAKAVEDLRSRGPAGLKQLLALRDELAKTLAETPIDLRQRSNLVQRIEKLDQLVDAVGGARYCSVSRLYWYTDLKKALDESRRTEKPVLSLRMLGKLTDEFSCANSRYFRTTLYANEKVADYLRAHYILHWESVRPVPRITIDFGDGRRLERTITGNSAHYVLAANGRPLEALPGLYGPKLFLEWLERSAKLAHLYATASNEQHDWLLQKYHAEQSDAVSRLWLADLKRVQPEKSASLVATSSPASDGAATRSVPAGKAAPLAITKSLVEVPLLKATSFPVDQLINATDESVWLEIAKLHADDARLDHASRALARRENPPDAALAVKIADTKKEVETPLIRMLRNLENSIALDSVKNEYLFHRQIHAWFAKGQAPANIHELNERVYAELFLTPSSDPWLGLAPHDTYTALDGGGVHLDSESRR